MSVSILLKWLGKNNKQAEKCPSKNFFFDLTNKQKKQQLKTKKQLQQQNVYVTFLYYICACQYLKKNLFTHIKNK